MSRSLQWTSTARLLSYIKVSQKDKYSTESNNQYEINYQTHSLYHPRVIWVDTKLDKITDTSYPRTLCKKFNDTSHRIARTKKEIKKERSIGVNRKG